jgi:hypothetical protein
VTERRISDAAHLAAALAVLFGRRSVTGTLRSTAEALPRRKIL